MDASRPVQELKDIKGTLDELVSKVNEAAMKFGSSEKHLCFLGDEVSKQRYQYLEKDALSTQ